MYANILLSTDGSDVARDGVKHGIALAKALNANATVITVTEPLLIEAGTGNGLGWIPSREDVDGYDAACKKRAGKVLDEARGMAEQIGKSTELLHVPNAHPCRWADDARLSDLEPRFACKACGKRGADVRPDFNWSHIHKGACLATLTHARRALGIKQIRVEGGVHNETVY